MPIETYTVIMMPRFTTRSPKHLLPTAHAPALHLHGVQAWSPWKRLQSNTKHASELPARCAGAGSTYVANVMSLLAHDGFINCSRPQELASSREARDDEHNRLHRINVASSAGALAPAPRVAMSRCLTRADPSPAWPEHHGRWSGGAPARCSTSARRGRLRSVGGASSHVCAADTRIW